jgi:hypothetical protein
MSEASKRPWEERLHEASRRMEEELRGIIQYLNDEVVPDVRRNGSDALRSAAVELQKLAKKMDDHRAGKTPPPPPPPKDTSKP